MSQIWLYTHDFILMLKQTRMSAYNFIKPQISLVLSFEKEKQ